MAQSRKKKAKLPEAEVEAEIETQSDEIEVTETEETKKVHLEFYGSEALREKAPQAFELAEAVADEWVKDGNFQKLPLLSPFAQLVATIGLQSAKRVEKKLEEKGVISIAKMGLELAKTKWPFKAQ